MVEPEVDFSIFRDGIIRKKVGSSNGGMRIAEFKTFEKNHLSVRNAARAEGGVDIKIGEDFEPVRRGV